MYPPQRMAGIIPATGNGSFPTPNQGSNQFPPAYNSQMPNYPGWNNQCQPQPHQPTAAVAAGQQTGQQGYNNPQQPNFLPSYAGGAQRAGAVGNNNFEYNNGQWQNSSNQQQQQWNGGWNNSGSPQEIAAKCPPAGNAGTNTATPTASAATASCDNSGNNYQRTFDYVQQCQTWSAQ